MEKKKKINKENPELEIPIMVDRLYYSYIWDKFSLKGLDDYAWVDPEV